MWVDVDALDLAVVGRQQCLQGGEVVAFDDEVVVETRLLSDAFGPHGTPFVVGDRKVMVLHEHPAFELQRWHSDLPVIRPRVR